LATWHVDIAIDGVIPGSELISVDNASGHSLRANERIHVDPTASDPIRFPRETELLLEFSPKLRA
jgi:hypothetical protein